MYRKKSLINNPHSSLKKLEKQNKAKENKTKQKKWNQNLKNDRKWSMKQNYENLKKKKTKNLNNNETP